MKWQPIRDRLTYANVAATLALFIALGGTSYAIATLPKNSVGARQVRTGAIRSAELRRGSVRSVDIHNRTVRLKDLRPAARSALRGQIGPPGPPGKAAVSLFLVADSAGGRAAGNGAVTGHVGVNGYVVTFPSSVAQCALVASPARVPSDAAVTDPPAGSTIIVGHQGNDALVRTYDQNHAPKGLPFALIAAC